MATSPIDVETAVRDRYSRSAVQPEAALCCPVDYDPQWLAVLPDEVVAKDYGCGDPSRHLREGETVLDLGAGAGKICFIASQVVGPTGRVIGVDMNADMLALARRYAPTVGDRIGWHNVAFHHGRIQDLALDLDAVEAWLADHPVGDAAGLAALEAEQQRLRREAPLVSDGTVDVVVSNCVLNLVREDEKQQLFPEIYRVLAADGRAVISDIVADEPVPDHLRADPELWSGCISGAMTETGFLAAFAAAGFHGMQIRERSDAPWRTVEGIEFRSVTVEAFKGKAGPCLETNKAVIYRGPWSQVVDDDGHQFRRGERTAVCEKTFDLMMRSPYAGQFETVLPRVAIDTATAAPFACAGHRVRTPAETKGQDYQLTTAEAPGCEGGACC